MKLILESGTIATSSIVSASLSLSLRLHGSKLKKPCPFSFPIMSNYNRALFLVFARGSSPDPCGLRNKPFLLTDPHLLSSGEISRTGRKWILKRVDSSTFGFASQRLLGRICLPLQLSLRIYCATNHLQSMQTYIEPRVIACMHRMKIFSSTTF
jgi:hypothetical protein